MSVFNEIKVLTTSTAINICNSNNNLSPDFLERNTPNKTTLNEINESIIILNDNDGGEATPTTPVANNSNSSTPNANSKVQQKNPKLYKTELCRSWMETGRCNYGERCQYAHGDREKRPVPRHPKYKTEPCQSYHKTGYCPYGPRCHFIHNENPNQLKALINANEQALRLVEFPPSGQDTKQQRSILTSSCSAASLGAYAAAMQSVNNINNNSNNNATGTPPIFSSGKMTPNGNCGGMSLFPAQRSNSAIVAYLNGQQHLLGKTQGFGSNPDNYNMFNNNMHLCQNSPPPLYDQQQQQNCQQQQYVNNLNFDETHIGNYSETNNLKSLWHETGRDVEFSLNNNCNQGLMVDHSNTFRPKTLDLFSPHATGWHSEQISPLHFSSIPYIHGEDSTENFQQQQQCHQRKILPVPLNTQKQHFLDFNDVGYENNELDAQQLLGNLCCASDDEYSRSSIISSNIDSGNESPPAASEDSANNKIIINSQQSSALFDLDESQEQQRRSSEGDDITATTTPINKNGDSHPLTTSSTQQQTIQNNETNIYNKSTASSSLASLLSSSSSNSANLIPQKSIIGDSEIFLLKSNNNKNNTSLNSTIPSSTPYLFSHVTGINVTTKSQNNTQEKKATTQQQQASSSSSSVRLPVFERLSLNQ